MANANGLNPKFDTVTSKRNVISGSGATRTISQDETGSTFLFDRAAGIVYTLPLAVVGTTFDFVVTTSVTSNAAKVITGAATELLLGSVLSNDTDTSGAAVHFDANPATSVAVSMNGTTTGGLIGTRLRFTCLSATKWLVEGVVHGSGVVATPFAAS